MNRCQGSSLNYCPVCYQAVEKYFDDHDALYSDEVQVELVTICMHCKVPGEPDPYVRPEFPPNFAEWLMDKRFYTKDEIKHFAYQIAYNGGYAGKY